MPMRISMRIGVAHDFCTNSAVWRIGHISIGTERCRQPTNVSLPTELLGRAKQPDVNISRASERDLREEVHGAEAHAWAAQHADFIAEFNAFCSPYVNHLRHDNLMNFDSKSPWSENSTIDVKMSRTASARTLYLSLAA
jgi:post-segregation antitoxin (ccd killing protein)